MPSVRKAYEEKWHGIVRGGRLFIEPTISDADHAPPLSSAHFWSAVPAPPPSPSSALEILSIATY